MRIVFNASDEDHLSIVWLSDILYISTYLYLYLAFQQNNRSTQRWLKLVRMFLGRHLFYFKKERIEFEKVLAVFHI